MIRRLSRTALLTAVGLILAWLEHMLLPSIAVPGVKIGLANLATLLAMYLLSDREALTVSALRVLLAGFLFGSLASLMYALSGALVSWIGMFLLKKIHKLSIVGVSVGGGCLHNVAQLLVAALAVQGSGIAAYLPVLIIAGTLTGCVNGIIVNIILDRVEKATHLAKKSPE